MKIAVPITDENEVNGHFGHSESYGVFTISDDKEITGMQTVQSPAGCGCKSDIASELAADGVTVLIAGGIGGGAVNKFTNNGISVIRGWSGDAADVVKLYLSGKVEDLGSSCHNHDDHEHHHHHHHGDGDVCGNN